MGFQIMLINLYWVASEIHKFLEADSPIKQRKKTLKR